MVDVILESGEKLVQNLQAIKKKTLKIEGRKMEMNVHMFIQ
jgi:hypothetical protein